PRIVSTLQRYGQRLERQMRSRPTLVAFAALVVLGTLSAASGEAGAQPANEPCASTAHHVNAFHGGSSCTQLASDAPKLWSTTLAGPASYPIIANGKIFVTTSNPGGGYGALVYALDASTGAIAWGPVPLGGTY